MNIEREEKEKEREEEIELVNKRKLRSKVEIKKLDEIKREQDKFFIDVGQDQSAKELINKLLADANNKTLGRPIILKDLVLFALPKLVNKDIEQVQYNVLTNLERIEKQRLEYNSKNKTHLDLGEYLVTVKNILKEGK